MAQQNLFLRLDRPEGLQQAVDRSFSEPVVLFKHSATCPVSAWAREEMLLLARGGTHPVYELVVQAARPLSDSIADRFAIRHESPQVIVLREGRPVFHASHRRVTALTVREAAAAGSPEEAAAPVLRA